MANQFRKISKTQRIFSILIIVAAALGSLTLFFLAWWGSGEILEDTPSPALVLMLWTGLAVGFLFGWSVGVLTDLQRSEPLSLQKFLHLPVSPQGAFLTNFLSSFVSFSMILMFPILLGLSLGMIQHYGPRMIPGILLLLGFVFLVGAWTWQFRGWLASLMIDKRRRRTIITVFTLSFILVSQIPNILNMTTFRDAEDAKQKRDAVVAEQRATWQARFDNHEISQQELEQKLGEIANQQQLAKLQRLEQIADWTRPFCIAIPLGWMPVGMESMARGRSAVGSLLVPAGCLLGLLGLSLLSLRRSWRSTLRMYRGELDRPRSQSESSRSTAADEYQPGWTEVLIQRKLPFLNEHQSAVATSTMVGVIRAPEAKMALLTPFLVMVLLGLSFAYRDGTNLPQAFRPFTGIGVATFAMLGIMQLINNQFGYDRSGFRCLVLSPARRSDILIGKNMAFAPFALGIGALGILAMQWFVPLKFTHLLATFVQLGTIYLVTCMVANFMSIRAPLAIAAGTMKPMNINLGVVVLQLLITILLPIGLLPTMLPPALDLVVNEFWDGPTLPVYLALSVLLFVATTLVYRWVVQRQALMFADRETAILDTVTQVGT